MELPYDPVILLLGIYPKELKSSYYSDTYIPMFIATQFTIAKLWNQPRCPSMDECIKKPMYIYEYTTVNLMIIFIHKKLFF